MNKPITCRTCGTPGLSWRQSAAGKWYLYSPTAVETTYGGNYVIPKAHVCLMPLYDEQGRHQGSIPARDFNRDATIAAINKRIAKLEFQQSLDAVDDEDLAELAALRADLAKFTN